MRNSKTQASHIGVFAIIAVFLLMIFAPAVEARLGFVSIPPVVESRARVPLPPGNPLAHLWQGLEYFPNYERHFNDVFGFRDFFIRVRNQIQYSLFADSDQVIIGRSGWLSDKSAVEVQQVAVDSLTDAQWTHLSQRVAALKQILGARGIYLIVVPIPLKNTVYPEIFPDQAVRRPPLTGEARFRKLLTDERVPFVDVFNLLSPRRYPIPVYYRTDVHWNHLGTAITAKRLVDQLAVAFHLPVRWTFPDRYADRPFVGGDESSLATFWSPVDVEPFAYWATDACGGFVPHGIGSLFVNTCRGRHLPDTAMFGNSFMVGMASVDAQNYFSTIHRFGDLTYFGNILSEIPPGTKIVVWQIFELEIGYQLQSDGYWAAIARAMARQAPRRQP
jgi:hypothetical protein